MKKSLFICVLVVLLSLNGCKTLPFFQKFHEKNIIELQILQLNDVYEIAPLEGGKVGGMARVATLKKQLLAKNPNTICVLAGDFLSPSVIGSLRQNNERIAGAQMVDVMNSVGVDYVAFGNHEFDIKEKDLQKRINASEFEWIGTNVFHKFQNGTLSAFHKYKENPSTKKLDSVALPTQKILTFQNAHGKSMSVELLGITLDMPNSKYCKITPWGAQPYVSSANLCLALTHQSRKDDIKMLESQANIALVMGGHEHENSIDTIMRTRFVCKADANAKTAYIHTIRYHVTSKKYTILSRLMKIDESIAQDISTQKVVNKWLAIENDLILKDSIRRNEIIATLKNPLDVRETLIRNKPSPIARLIAQSLSFSAPLADAAIFNTGSLRLDDVLNNNITQYDVLRLLPFGGRVVEAEMKGDLLENILNIGHTENLGTGGYLQHDNISLQQMQWTVKGKPIDKEQYYRIALPEFLLTGEEQNLKFLTKTHPSIRKIIEPTPESPNRNIQLTVIAFLKAKKWQE